ncbi:MAG: lipopolysaccharide assembly protein LapB [Methylococcaceae bacterium]|jgi:lipopolysaccharide biosynthesis regulator YciM
MVIEDMIAILLPVAAASGWFAAKKHYTRKYLTDYARPLTQAYRRGLNYLLDEKTDKAIAAVAHILEQEYEPIETHIALGNLFRRRGEVERAIDIHSKLLQDPILTDHQKTKANFELGVDYMRAGLFDRAEAIFHPLSSSKTHGRGALQHLLQIYQQEKDWVNAIDCVRQLQRMVKPRQGETAAHFFCELADEAMHLHRLKDARDFLVQALADDPQCVRASIAKAKLEFGNGEYHQALQTLKNIELQNPVYLPVALPMIRLCWERQGDNGLTEYLERIYQNFGVVAAALEVAERIRESRGLTAAIDYLLPVIEANPDSGLIYRVLDFMTEDRSSAADRIRRINRALHSLVLDSDRYHCIECGFRATELHWRCPSCQFWGSIIPL